MTKKGDTLIEVMLAVGIFSMIAIAITSVMSSGTSGAQTALETTLAREEIDEQAEALRFIHSSYIADRDSRDQRFRSLWKAITNQALRLKGDSTDSSILQYMPESCISLYQNGKNSILNQQKAFIINPQAMGSFTEKSVEKVFISSSNQFDKFAQATIYPRLIYGKNDQAQSLAEEDSSSELFKAEGIYIVAVKDKNTTTITNSEKKASAFYDFYIRTCWYGSDANQPSTISTVIRLYDPDVIVDND